MIKTLGIVDGVIPPETTTGLGGIHNRRFAGQSLLSWIARRASDAQLLSQVIVLSSREHDISHLVPADIQVEVSTAADALSRFADVVSRSASQAIVRIRMDQPFTDPDLIDGLIARANAKPQCDYISYCTNDGRPTVHSRIGVFAEWCRASAIERAHQEAQGTERSDATRYIYSHPELFNLSFIPAPAQLDRSDVRLCIEAEEDWDHAQTIVDALDGEEVAWKGLANLLDRQPALRKRMAALNQESAARP